MIVSVLYAYWQRGIRYARCDTDPEPDHEAGPYTSTAWCGGCSMATASVGPPFASGLLCRRCHAYRDERALL